MSAPPPSGDEVARSEVTFATIDPDLDTPAVAVHLAAALTDAGFRCDAPRDIGGPVSLRVRAGRRGFSLLIGQLPGERRWLVSTSSGVMPMMRLLGDRADDQRRELVTAIHEALAARPELVDIRWFAPGARRGADDDPWAATPSG